jgi:hypothetical protein
LKAAGIQGKADNGENAGIIQLKISQKFFVRVKGVFLQILLLDSSVVQAVFIS